MKYDLRLGLAVVGVVLAIAGIWLCVKNPFGRHAPAARTLVVTEVKPAPELPILVKGNASAQSLESAPSIRQAVWNKSLPFDARVRGVRALGPTLDEPERQLLLDYLKQAQPDDSLNTAQREALKNDAINALRIQVPPVQELTSVLITIAQNKSETPVMRDYALQHLSQYRDKAAALDPKQATQIDDALWQATGDRSQTSAGTALLALAYSVDTKQPGAPAPSELGARSLAIASDQNAPVGNRMTALSIAGRMGENDALPVAFTLALDNKQCALQRVALATLAQLARQGVVLPSDKKAALRQALGGSSLLSQPSFRTYLAN